MRTMRTGLRACVSLDFRILALSAGLVAAASGAIAQSAPATVTAAGKPAGSSPTFSRDVLPILQGHCQECHRPNQIAPMSFLEYNDVRPWAKAIRNEVVDRKMPPFYANAPLGHFENDKRLTDAQIETLIRWIDAGVPAGNPKEAPSKVQWPSEGWLLGTPDVVLEFAEFATRGDNKDQEVLLYSERVFKSETWVQAFEFRTDNYKVVHHANVIGVNEKFYMPRELALDPDDKRANQLADGRESGTSLMEQRNPLYTWLPGQQVEKRAKGDGLLIRAGDRIVLQVHAAPTTEPVRFKIALGLKLVNGDLDTVSRQKLSMLNDLVIPAGESHYERTSWREFKTSVNIDGFGLHMHLRGKSGQVRFHYPDGRVETVFDVPHYSFDWQREYRLSKPLTVPAGTKVEFIAAWDNSRGNLRNPDPTVEVRSGKRTTDEMYGGIVYFSAKRGAPLRVVNGVSVSPDPEK